MITLKEWMALWLMRLNCDMYLCYLDPGVGRLERFTIMTTNVLFTLEVGQSLNTSIQMFDSMQFLVNGHWG